MPEPGSRMQPDELAERRRRRTGAPSASGSSGRGDQRDLVVEERAPGDPLVLGRAAGDRDVDLVLEHPLEQRGAVGDLEREVDLGVELP